MLQFFFADDYLSSFSKTMSFGLEDGFFAVTGQSVEIGDCHIRARNVRARMPLPDAPLGSAHGDIASALCVQAYTRLRVYHGELSQRLATRAPTTK